MKGEVGAVGLWIAYGLWVMDYVLWIMGYGLWFVVLGFWGSGCFVLLGIIKTLWELLWCCGNSWTV